MTTCWEVGPGRGALTQHLIGTVRHLTLVELDDDLAASLEQQHADRDDVSVIHGDVLKVPMNRLPGQGSLRVIGNIPYNITTPIIFRFLERPRPIEMVFMVQAEVADRIVAPVGTKAYGALSIGVRSVARVQRLFTVSRGAFRPVPGVDSAIIRITPLQARTAWGQKTNFVFDASCAPRFNGDESSFGESFEIIRI